MTTDITELALIAKIKKQTENFDTVVLKEWEALALVDALEKAQQVDEELCKLLPPGAEYMDSPDGGDVTPLEGVRRMVADYRQRIAELESRTVKMPHRNLGHPKLFLLCPFPYYDAEDMEKNLTWLVS